jgi:peptidoglycan-associated lipoprotein
MIIRAGAIIALGLVIGCTPTKTGNVESTGGTSIGAATPPPSTEPGELNPKAGGPLADIHFGYNDYTVQPQDGAILQSNATWLQAHPNVNVQVEGNCDERGSEDYNIALGAKRAQSAKDYLATLGISPGRISTISYGKELPICHEQGEDCWQQNRRDHFVVSGGQASR